MKWIYNNSDPIKIIHYYWTLNGTFQNTQRLGTFEAFITENEFVCEDWAEVTELVQCQNYNPTLYLFMIITTLYTKKVHTRVCRETKLLFISELCFVVCQQIVIYLPYTKRSCVSNSCYLYRIHCDRRARAAPLILFARSILHQKPIPSANTSIAVVYFYK